MGEFFEHVWVNCLTRDTYEASRLARNNADWYRLIELAALDGALLADADGVYDPRL